jgi:hypothetical protein
MVLPSPTVGRPSAFPSAAIRSPALRSPSSLTLAQLRVQPPCTEARCTWMVRLQTPS